MKKIYTILCIAIASAMSIGAYPVFGTYSIECPADSDTYVGISTTREAVFTGKVQSIQSGTTNIVAKGEPNWTENQYVYVKGSQNDHYYIKFTSGELEGVWYDIKSNGAYFVEIEIGASDLAKIQVNDSFQIIPHWTLGTLFPDGAGFTKAVTSTNASRLWKYTAWEEGTGVKTPIGYNKAYLKSYYFRQSGTRVIGWRDANNLDSTNDVIEPGSFFKIVQPANKAATITINGVIPFTSTSMEVFMTKDENGNYPNQDIYYTVPSATDITLNDLTSTLIESGIFATSKTAMPNDTISIYMNQTTGKNVAADYACYYLSRGTVNKWRTTDGVDAGNIVLKACSVIKLRKKSLGSDYAQRVNFKPTYVE